MVSLEMIIVTLLCHIFGLAFFLDYTIPGFVLFDEQKILFQKIIFNMEIMKKIRVIGKF